MDAGSIPAAPMRKSGAARRSLSCGKWPLAIGPLATKYSYFIENKVASEGYCLIFVFVDNVCRKWKHKKKGTQKQKFLRPLMKCSAKELHFSSGAPCIFAW